MDLTILRVETMQTGSMGPALVGIFIFILLLLVIVLIVANIKIVPQAHAYVVERLGTYAATWATGLHFKIPFIDRIAKKFL